MNPTEIVINGRRYALTPLDDEILDPDPILGPVETSIDRWTGALRDLEPEYPTGAWGKTAGGREASIAEEKYNSTRLPNLGDEDSISNSYIRAVRRAALTAGLPTGIFMGIFGRESNHGRSLDSRGYGDRGNGFGVGQVDSRYHVQKGKPDPYSIEHMQQCAGIFKEYLSQVETKHPVWHDRYILKGAAVAYNSGVKNVATIERMDIGTTGNDYGADVMCRAQYWQDIFEGAA